MKICKIRGENLASLQSRFEVDFEDATLAHAGVVAIVGPTGAGKSTLIDAVTLALHGEIPRLAQTPRGRSGDAETGLTFADPRNVVRRDAGHAFAEVEFIGQDRRRYVAKWSVQRARRKADGALQKATMSLLDHATGEVLGDKVKEVQHLVEQKVGLSFQELCRSVVLPQNDVAAFLKAPAAERGGLLEKLTGTAVYSDLSRRAHELAGAAREAHDRLVVEGAAHRVLPLDAREALTALHDARARAAAVAQDALAAARADVLWHEEHAAREAAVDDAARTLARAEAAHAAAAAARADHARTVAARALAHLLVSARAGDAARAAAEDALAGAVRAYDELAARRVVVEARTTAAEGALAGAQAVRAGSETALMAATRLDVHKGAADRALADAAALRDKRVAAAAVVDAARADLRARRAALVDARAANDRALAEQPAHAALVSKADVVAGALGRHVAAAAAARSALALEAEEAERARAALHDAHVLRESADEQAAIARRAHDVVVLQADLLHALDLPGLHAQASAAEEERTTLAALAALVESAVAHDADRASALDDAARADVESASAAQRRIAGTGELTLCDVRGDEARRALERLQATQDLAVHRAALVEGEACPLCGALEHPRAQDAPAAPSAIADARGRVDELARARDQLVQDVADAVARIGSAQGEGDRARARAATAASLVARDAARFVASHGSAAFGADPTTPGLRAAIAERAVVVQDLVARVRSGLARGVERSAVLDSARAAFETARAIATAADGAAAPAELHAVAAVGRHDAQRIAAAELEARAAAAYDEARALVADVPGAATALRDDAAGFERRLHDEIVVCALRAARATDLLQSIHELEPQLADAEARAIAAADACAEAAAAAATIEAQRAELAALRATVLDGRAPDVVRDELDDDVAAAAAALEAHRSTEAELRATAAGHAATIDAATARRAVALAEAEQARALRDVALASSSLSATDAEERAQRPADVVDAQRVELASLDERMRDARAVLGERRRVASEHAAQPKTATSPGAAQETLQQAGASSSRAASALQETDVQLRVDDDAVARRMELFPKIDAAQREADRWARLSDVIGSADGKKLRGFAQSLTLDALVAAANHHLEDFAPRFQLMRVPQSELDLQLVDRDMGDEVRGVQLLSGGETFLVSLAFALGISSLSSQDVTIESLFIDEGFGGLDRRSLERAVTVLEGLHASGRTVAVVSHVPELIDRLAAKVRVQPNGRGASTVAVEVD